MCTLAAQAKRSQQQFAQVHFMTPDKVNPERISQQISWLSRGWVISVGTLLMAMGLAGTALYVQYLKTELVSSMAVEDAARYSEALQEFRTLYTSEVVERAMTSERSSHMTTRNTPVRFLFQQH